MNESAVEAAIPIRWVVPPAVDGGKVVVRHTSSPDPKQARRSTLLLVSDDVALMNSFCQAAAEKSLSVVQAHSLREATEQANRSQLVASLLDLDLPGDVGWQLAEWLLGHKPSIRILMLTARAEHHELSAAIRSGVVFEKTIGAARLLHAAVVMLEQPAQQAHGRVALQQAWLRQAKPYRWEDAGAYGYQHWGIND